MYSQTFESINEYQSSEDTHTSQAASQSASQFSGQSKQPESGFDMPRPMSPNAASFQS